ncbi:MAG: tetratricopeptide repeat protein [Flavobacteriales bacterium]
MRILLFVFVALQLFACKVQKNATSRNKGGDKDTLARIAAQAMLIDGMIKKSAGDAAGALRDFEACIHYLPTCDAAYYHLSGLYMMQGRSEMAIASADRAAELDPKNEWYLLQAANISQKNGDLKKSISTYEKLIKLNPEKPDYYLPYSDVLLQSGQADKAILALEKLEKLRGYDEAIIFQKFQIYSSAKKYDKAIAEIEKMIVANPSEVRNYGIIAELYMEIGQTQKALDYYNKILGIDPDNGLVHLALADYQWRNNNPEGAFLELKKAFESSDLEIDTKMKILLDYYDRPNDKELTAQAYELLEIVIKVHPNEGKAWSIYGDFLNRDKKHNEAREKFRKAIEFERNYYAIWNQVVNLDAVLNDTESLYTDSKEAEALFPQQPGFYFYHALGAYRKGKYNEALDALLAGKDLVVDNTALQFEFLQLLGDTYHKLGNHTESDNAYEQALGIDPNNTYLLNNYAYYLCERRVKLEKAAAMSKKSNELEPNQSNFQDTYAWILFRQSKFADAEVWIKKALSSGGQESGTILEHYGDILFHTGKTEEALIQWKKAKEKTGAGNNLDRKIRDKKYYE